MANIVTATVGAILGIAAIWLGFDFHIGSWIIGGPWGAFGAAVSGAVIALILRYVARKEYGIY